MNRENFGMKIRVLENLPELKDSRLDLAVSIALSTGLRRTEILNLRAEDMLDQGAVKKMVRVRRKGAKFQTIYLPDKLREKITLFLGERKTGYLLTNGKHPEQRYPATSLCYDWHKAQTEAGIPRAEQFRWHDLRHTAITRFLRETNNLRLAQVFAGHANLNTTAIYTHPTEDEMFTAMQEIENKGGTR
jgi:integrase/recombinase XerC